MSSPPGSKQRRRETQSGGLVRHALLEVRPRLQSAYCFLRLAVDTSDPTFRLVSVEARGDRPGLDVCLEYRGRTFSEPVEVERHLAALSGPVTVAGHYAVFRARLTPDERRGSAAAEIVPTDATAPPPPPRLWRPTVDGRYRAACRRCGTDAVDMLCRRALPLPSENWREMLGNVFCHGDGADQNMHERVRARPGDCFYAASHVVLSADDVKCRSHDRRLLCAGCAAPLGEAAEFGARLWHHGLTWSAAGVEELRLDPSAVLRRLLVHGGHSCDAPAARLLATAPRHEPLLLWLVDTNLTVHLVTRGDREGGGDGTCNGRSDGGGGGGGGSGGEARSALKILYRSCDEEATRRHRADLQVLALELDEVLMATLRGELERSQRWYPDQQRTVGEDQVGLLLL